MTPSTRNLSITAALVFVAGAYLVAGPLNPPTGPVSAGGKATQEIYDAVTNISSAIGSAGGRTPAVPGANALGGTCSLGTTPPISGPILGMRHAVSAAVSFVSGSGTSVGRATPLGLTIVREAGVGDATLLRHITLGLNIPTMTITTPVPGGGSLTYVLTTSFCSGLRQYQIQRGDGTFATIQEWDFVSRDVRITDAAGVSWNYNFSTGQGTP